MKKTLVAVFDDPHEAEATAKELREIGITEQEISLIANRAACGPNVGPIPETGSQDKTGQGIAMGAIGGFTAGVVALALPGIGPIIAAGPLAAGLAGAGTGAAAGGLLGRLFTRGVTKDEAGCYCEAIRRGGILLTVEMPDEHVERVEYIVGKHRTLDIEDCAEAWREEGWTGFQAEAPPTPHPKAPMALAFDPARMHSGKHRQSRGARTFRVS